MPRGTLEVILVGAKNLHDNDFFRKMDPYVILTYRAQEQRSSVAKGAGSNPRWNESFLFAIFDNVYELNLRLMDKDTYSKDELLGETIIHLGPVLVERSIPETPYNVVRKQKHCGEVHVALIFYPETKKIEGSLTIHELHSSTLVGKDTKDYVDEHTRKTRDVHNDMMTQGSWKPGSLDPLAPRMIAPTNCVWEKVVGEKNKGHLHGSRSLPPLELGVDHFSTSRVSSSRPSPHSAEVTKLKQKVTQGRLLQALDQTIRSMQEDFMRVTRQQEKLLRYYKSMRRVGPGSSTESETDPDDVDPY